MLFLTVSLLGFAASSLAQNGAEGSTIIIEGARTLTSDLVTGTPTYADYTSTETISSSTIFNSTSAANSTTTATDTDAYPTLLVGTNVANGSATGTETSTAPEPTNTQPCNGYVEYCERRYSNITMVAAHNSPFVQDNNAASNQDYGIFSQLNDGIRMLQGQTHMWNGELRFCHTSCDLLDAGTVEDYLADATEWLRNHPFEVITILLGNQDFLNVAEYVDAIESSGIRQFLYEPPEIPMGIDDWPTLGRMILTGRRAVIFMDYNADQTSVPYVLDQFSQLWETPFSPTDPEFPCYVNRPPDLSDEDARDRMYLANHNLNVDIAVAGLSILIPDRVNIDRTNSDELEPVGTLGMNVQNCTRQWGRAPNFLIVDYYNRGNFNGSVFAAAAAANGVEYNGEGCCGEDDDSPAEAVRPGLILMLAALLATFVTCF